MSWHHLEHDMQNPKRRTLELPIPCACGTVAFPATKPSAGFPPPGCKPRFRNAAASEPRVP